MWWAFFNIFWHFIDQILHSSDLTQVQFTYYSVYYTACIMPWGSAVWKITLMMSSGVSWLGFMITLQTSCVINWGCGVWKMWAFTSQVMNDTSCIIETEGSVCKIDPHWRLSQDISTSAALSPCIWEPNLKMKKNKQVAALNNILWSILITTLYPVYTCYKHSIAVFE